MKSLLLAAVMFAGVAAQAATESKYVHPVSGGYTCQAYRAYDSKEETGIIKATVDEIEVVLKDNGQMNIETVNGNTRYYTDYKVKQNALKRKLVRYSGGQNSEAFFLTKEAAAITSVSYIDVGSYRENILKDTMGFSLYAEFRREDANRSHWNRIYRCTEN